MEKVLNKEQQMLVCRNLPLAAQLAGRFGSVISADRSEKCITRDDLTQEAALGLIRAAMTFRPDAADENGAASFRTWAYIWIRKYVLMAVRKYGSVETIRLDVLMLDAAIAEDADTEVSEERICSLRRAMSTLNGRERKVLDNIFALDRSNAETATELGLARSRITQIKAAALRKIELAMAA